MKISKAIIVNKKSYFSTKLCMIGKKCQNSKLFALKKGFLGKVNEHKQYYKIHLSHSNKS